MKLNTCARLVVVGLALSLLATGCKTKKTGPTPLGNGSDGAALGQRNPDAANALQGGQDGLTGSDLASATGFEAAPFDPDLMNQDRAALAAYTIYFAYDSSSVSPGEQSKIEAVAAALTADASAKLLIEGHCDERGTEEYNRSLGERRALSAREALAALGVDPGRVATRSYGEDRPAEMGHDDAAWSRNRRGEFVVLHAR
jgi:peptidoglycan-associated lipoprotein